MKNWFIFLLLLCSGLAVLLPCKWVHIEQKNSGPFYYLRQSSHGSCHYQFISSSQGKSRQIVFFFNDLKYHDNQLIVANCKVRNDQVADVCPSFSFSNLLSDRKNKVQLITKRSSDQSSDISIAIKEENSMPNIKQTKTIQIYGVKEGQQPNETMKAYLLEYESICYLVLLIMNLVLLSFVVRESMIKAYQWLQQLTIIKIIVISTNSIISINSHFQFEPVWLYNLLSIILYFLNFLIIGFCLKLLLDYIQFGPIQFKTNEGVQLNTSQWINQSQLVQGNHDKKLANRFSSFGKQFIQAYYNQSGILKRIEWLTIFILVEAFLQTDYYVVNIAIQSLLFVIIPAYFQLRNVNTSTELLFDIFCFELRDNPAKRDEVLFPKLKLHVFFIICLQYYAFNFLAYQNDAVRLKLQLGIIAAMWVITIRVLFAIVNKKLGKQVKVYSVRKLEKNSRWKGLRQNSKVLQFLYQRYQKLFHDFRGEKKYDKKEDCCICLEEICIQKSVETECGHIFHAQCLSMWTRNKMICPVDRNSLNQKMVEKAIFQATQQK